jgi:NDP-sugar pyrophosphorylase family protein
LVLRSGGPNPNVTFDPATGRVRDLRQALGTAPERFHQFTGIYLVHPEFLRYLRPVPESVVPAFLRAITDGARIGGIVLDEGSWRDLGDRDTYLEANAALARAPSFLGEPTAPLRIAPSARIGAGAEIDRLTVIGDGCRVGAGARLEACVLWPGAVVAPGADLRRCVLTGRDGIGSAEGRRDGADL